MYASSGSKLVHVVSYPRYVVMWNVIQEQDAVLLYIVFASRQCLACQILTQNEHKLLDQAPLRIAVTALSALGFCLALLSEHKEQTGRTAQKCKI